MAKNIEKKTYIDRQIGPTYCTTYNHIEVGHHDMTWTGLSCPKLLRLNHTALALLCFFHFWWQEHIQWLKYIVLVEAVLLPMLLNDGVFTKRAIFTKLKICSFQISILDY